MKLDETHDPALTSWVESANVPGCDFPIQNLPFGIFRRKGRKERPRGAAEAPSRALARVARKERAAQAPFALSIADASGRAAAAGGNRRLQRLLYGHPSRDEHRPHPAAGQPDAAQLQ